MLTEQRKRFVEELIRLRAENHKQPQRQAAINAGYSEKTADSQASQILKDPKVSAYYEAQKTAQMRGVWEKLGFMALEAVKTVYAIMTNEDAEDKDRLKAALEILDRAGFRADDRNAGTSVEEELPKLLEALQEDSK